MTTINARLNNGIYGLFEDSSFVFLYVPIVAYERLMVNVTVYMSMCMQSAS